MSHAPESRNEARSAVEEPAATTEGVATGPSTAEAGHETDLGLPEAPVAAAGEQGSGATPASSAGSLAAEGTAEVETPPRLQPLYGSPCRLYFPAGAESDEGDVVVRTHVDAFGHIARVDVVQERPAAQGFGRAAKGCAQRLKFAPARNARHVAIPGDATLQLHFTRG